MEGTIPEDDNLRHKPASTMERDDTKAAKKESVDVSTVQPPTIPPPTRPIRRTNQLKFLQEHVLKAVWNNRCSYPFQSPVNAKELNLPDYHTIVKKPMDLGTIKKRLENWYYWSGQDCVQDFNTMISNCYRYNQPDDEVVTMAEKLEKVFRAKLALMPEYEVKLEPTVLKGKTDARGSSRRSRPSQKKATTTDSLKKVNAKTGADVSTNSKKQAQTDVVVQASNVTLKPRASRKSIPRRVSKKPPKNAEPFTEKFFKRFGRCTEQLIFLHQEVLKPLCNHPYSWPFLQPVDGAKFKDYYSIVDNPIDFGTIKKRLTGRYYQNGSDCKNDIERVFSNCRLYNPPGEEILSMADELEKLYNEAIKKLPPNEQEFLPVVTKMPPLKKSTLSKIRSCLQSFFVEAGEASATVHSSGGAGSTNLAIQNLDRDMKVVLVSLMSLKLQFRQHLQDFKSANASVIDIDSNNPEESQCRSSSTSDTVANNGKLSSNRGNSKSVANKPNGECGYTSDEEVKIEKNNKKKVNLRTRRS